MIRPRITPCLLIQNSGLVKTINFRKPVYLGDPINAVKIFNEKEVDELIILDIDATTLNREPNYKQIKNIADQCRMPLCYGGGITTPEQAKKIVSLGVEKIAISAAALLRPALIKEIAEELGRQSVVIVIDVKKKRFSHKYEVWSHNAEHNSHQDIFEWVDVVQKYGAGEIVINSIDKDGCMEGYDISLIQQIKKKISIPITILGGAGSTAHLSKAVEACGLVGISAGSLFVYKGKYKAVLINYIENKDKVYAQIAQHLIKK